MDSDLSMFRSGMFTIKTLYIGSGGDLAQGKSVGLTPKPIITIPEGARPGVFYITPVPGSRDNLRVTIRSQPNLAQVVGYDGLLYGFVTPAPEQYWRLVPHFHWGPHVYSIQRADEELVGWLLKDDRPDTQVSVGHLPHNRANPRKPDVLIRGLFLIVPA